MKHAQIASGHAHVVNFLAHRMKQDDPALADLFQYWNGLRQRAQLPRRQDIDAGVFESTLSNGFILDRPRPGVVRFRAAGQGVSGLMGMEVRGMPIRAFFHHLERHKLMETVGACFALPAGVSLDLTLQGACDAPVRGRMLILPMRDENGNVTKALGGITAYGHPDTVPPRFRIERAQFGPLAAPPDARDGKPHLSMHSEARALGMNAPASPYRSTPSHKTAQEEKPKRFDTTGVPHLRIVRDE